METADKISGLSEALTSASVAARLKNSFARYADGITSAFVFGSVAKGSDSAASDIDILVIGDDLNFSDLYTAAQEAELVLERPVHPLFMTPKDWRRHIADEGSVINKISQSPKLYFIGSDSELPDGKT